MLLYVSRTEFGDVRRTINLSLLSVIKRGARKSCFNVTDFVVLLLKIEGNYFFAATLKVFFDIGQVHGFGYDRFGDGLHTHELSVHTHVQGVWILIYFVLKGFKGSFLLLN